MTAQFIWLISKATVALLLTGTTRTAEATATEATATALLVFLILLELLGSHDLLQFLVVGLSGLGHLFAHLFHTGALLISHLRHLSATESTLGCTAAKAALRTTLTATTTTTTASHTSEAHRHLVGILCVKLQQLLGLIFVQTILLYGVLRTLFNHLGLVCLRTLLRGVIRLCES